MNQQVSTLFRELADLPIAERESVFAARGISPEVRAQVESLLACDSRDHILTACIGQAAQRLTADDAGDSCGPYRLIRSIGSGGMGAVYLAERADGEIQQRVAVKMLRAEADHPTWHERFLRERQILADLNHPSIARLLDAGRTDHGQPYLVMEYVDGMAIDDYSRGRGLREQLALFLKVCEGVAHAHRHLVIHRDLKPSNILVDAAGQPKVLDFGIAKLLDDDANQTQTVERWFTPNYASPEQLRGSTQTTATDIYSLGAVLYEILTGRSPHLSETGESQAIEIVAGAREIASPRRLNPTLPADLDFILRKALRRSPDERYASVEALSNDIRAFLRSEPVQARSGDTWYRARKFARRYWLPFAATALIIASLSTGLYIANRERAVAQRRFLDVRQMATKLFDIDSAVGDLPGSAKARQMIVDTSLTYLRRLTADAQGDPELALEVGDAYRRVAEVEGVTIGPNLGQIQNAERDLGIADGLIQSVLRKQPANRLAFLRAAQVSHDRMAVAWQGGHNDGSLAFALQSADWLEKLKPGKADKAWAIDILTVYANVAHQYMITDRLDDALRLCARGLELAKVFDAPYMPARFLDTRALALRYQGDLDGALAAIRESVRLWENFPAKRYGTAIGLSMALAREGWILGGGEVPISLGRAKEAVEVLDRAFQIADELVHKDANDESSRSRLFMAGGPLGEILLDSDPKRALDVFDHTYRDMSQIDSRLLQIREVDLLAGSADALRMLGRHLEARQRLDQAFALLGKLSLYPADKIEAGSEAGRALLSLAEYEAGAGNVRRALEVYDTLLRLTAGGAKPETSLQDAACLSYIWTSMTALCHRARREDLAAQLQTRRIELWRQWDRKLPGNAFVARQLANSGANSRDAR